MNICMDMYMHRWGIMAQVQSGRCCYGAGDPRVSCHVSKSIETFGNFGCTPLPPPHIYGKRVTISVTEWI